MKKLALSLRTLVVFLLCAGSVSTFGQTGLVISQVYGGGGNAGATFTYDFIELYNSSNAAINLGGLSVQYASAASPAGTTWNAATLPAYSLAARHYYLIQAAAGATPAQALPTPDLVLTLDAPSNVSSSFLINLAAGAGKLALVSNTTPLTAACPTGPSVIDLVGYGTTANCFEGTAGAPPPSNNATSIIRTTSTDTNNNAADFSTISPPAPRNSSFGSAGNLNATGVATPAVLTTGDTTLFTVAVTPALSPASTGITVVANLTPVGGSAAQTLYDDGTHGDVTAGDNTYSFSSIATTAVSGAVSLSATVTDAQNHTVSASIALTVNQPVPVVAIHDIQGVKSLTAEVVSPYAGKTVQTSGIVTAITGSGFFLQTPSPDANPLTPEGILVYTGTGKVPASVAVGNSMQVSGTLATFPALNTASHIPSTELSSPLTITPLSTGNALPAPVALTAANLTPGGGIYQMTPYEGMRVSFASLTSTSGTDGSLNEASETTTSNGEFYAVVTGTPQPFREPGIDLRDPVVDATKTPTVFDDNPERLFVDSGYLVGSTPINVSTGAVLPNVTGVVDFSGTYDDNGVPARLLIDPAYNVAAIAPGRTVKPVPVTPANQFTVASFNIERFYNPAQATPDNLYFVPAGVNGYNGSSSTATVSTGQTFVSGAVNVTAAAYQRRLQKVSLAIRTVLNTPDIVTLEEVENQSVANDIASQINTDAGIANLYTAYSTDNSTFYTQDGTGISVGFLVKNSTVNKLGFTQFGQGHTFTVTGATNPITLNDRPWLVLNAGIKRANAKDYPVTVIVNHMKALTGVSSATSTSTRQKKELQAEDIAKYIQTAQAAGQHVISGGDFNAFEFSDGYTDTLATYTNTNVLPAAKVVQPGVAGLVTPPLTNLALLLPANERWSYNESGSSQILDQMVVTQDLASAGAHLVYAHLDSDFPLTAYNDASTPARVSDHDAAVGYFVIPPPTSTASLTPASGSFGTNVVGVASTGQVFTFTNTGETALAITSVTASGDYKQTNNCGSSVAIGASCTANVVLTASSVGTRNGTLAFVTNAGSYSSSLTGTGVAAPNFTLGDSTGSASTTVTVAAGATGTANLTFNPVGGFTGVVALTCAAQGTAATGVTCNVPPNFTLGPAASTQTVTFTTTSRTTSSGIGLQSLGGSWSTIVALALTGLLMLLAGRTRGRLRMGGLLALLLVASLAAVGCSADGKATVTNQGGTAAGTYIYTVTASSGSTSHAETVTLIVQ